MSTPRLDRLGLGTALLALGILAAAPVGVAGQDVARGWLPFIGCWEPLEAGDAGLLCVRPEGDGVEMMTIADGEVVTRDLITADGLPAERIAEECDGWETAEFSASGRFVYTRSEFACGGEPMRTATGVMSLVSPTQWLDVRSVSVEGDDVAWVQRYRLVGLERMTEAGVEGLDAAFGLSVRSARMGASRALRMDEVEEAVGKVTPKAVEAWIAARQERFTLDADELVRLVDAGVPESVIDVMVAVSYPAQFAIDGGVERERGTVVAGGAGMGGLYGGRAAFGSRAFWWDPFYYGYSPYSSRYGYAGGYGGYGYGYGYGGLGGYGYGGYYAPTTVIIDRVTNSAPRGRAVNGRGYTRTGGSSAGSVPRSSTGGSTATSSGGGGASSQPASSGGTRKAKRRGGG